MKKISVNEENKYERRADERWVWMESWVWIKDDASRKNFMGVTNTMM